MSNRNRSISIEHGAGGGGWRGYKNNFICQYFRNTADECFVFITRTVEGGRLWTLSAAESESRSPESDFPCVHGLQLCCNYLSPSSDMNGNISQFKLMTQGGTGIGFSLTMLFLLLWISSFFLKKCFGIFNFFKR